MNKVLLSLGLLASTNAVASWFKPEPKKPDVKLFFKDPAVIEVTEAAVQNNVARVKELLAKQKIDLNFPGYLWATPMHFAMVWSGPEIIAEFYKHGGNPLILAYSHGTPLGNMMTSTNTSPDEKINRLKSLKAAGFDFKTAEFLDEYRYLTSSMTSKEAETQLNDYLFGLGLKDFLTAKIFRQPDEIRFFLEDGRGKKYDIPEGTLVPMQVSVHLVGEQAIADGHLEDYFQQALKNLKAVKSTWHQTPIELKKNSDYLAHLKITGDQNRKAVIFDAAKLFPEWKSFLNGKSDEAILLISSSITTTWKKENELVCYSENATLSPVFERIPGSGPAF